MFSRFRKQPARLVAPQFVHLSQPEQVALLGLPSAAPLSGAVVLDAWQARFETVDPRFTGLSYGHAVTVVRHTAAGRRETDSEITVHVETLAPPYAGACEGVWSSYSAVAPDLAAAAELGLKKAFSACQGSAAEAMPSSLSWSPLGVRDIWWVDDAVLPVEVTRFSITRPGCHAPFADGATHDVRIVCRETAGRLIAVQADIEIRAVQSEAPPELLRVSLPLEDAACTSPGKALAALLTKRAVPAALAGEGGGSQASTRKPAPWRSWWSPDPVALAPVWAASLGELQHATQAAVLRSL